MAVRLDSPDAFIMVYTRMVEENTYPSGLAGSLHLAVSRDGRTYRALNRNYGVLFVRGMVRADNTICPLRAETPRVLRLKNGKYLIAARNPVLLEFLKKEEKLCGEILSSLEGKSGEHIERRRAEVQEKKEKIRLAKEQMR